MSNPSSIQWVPQQNSTGPTNFRNQPCFSNSLDSLTMERALSKITSGQRRWVAKHIIGHFSHGKNMVCRGHWSSAQCPQCQANLEDKVHILKCPAPSAQTQWELSITKLSNWLKEQGTDPGIQLTIIGHLHQWACKDPPEHPADPFVEEQ